MKLRNDRAVLRSTYLFGGLPLTKSEIRKVEIVPRRQTPICRAGSVTEGRVSNRDNGDVP